MRIAAFAATIFFLLAVQQATLPAERTAGRYGAIAYSWSSGSWGISSNLLSQSDAENAARKNCGSRDCDILLLFRGECAALAEGQGRKVGVARAPTLDQSQRAAIENCQRSGGQDCRVLASQCSS